MSALRDLPETWRKVEGGSGRRLLASALFDWIEVLELRGWPCIYLRTRSGTVTFQECVWIDAGGAEPLRLMRSA